MQQFDQKMPAKNDLKGWVLAFQCCPGTAIHHVPNDVYQTLRSEGYIDSDHEPTEKGRSL